METSETINCGVTGWFYRRTILPGLVCVAVAGWFFFDGFVVYPKKMRIYQEYRAYTTQRDLLLRPASDPLHKRAEKDWERAARAYPDFSAEMRWPDLAQRYGWAATNPPDWPAYARTRGYFETLTKKHRIIPADIAGQMVTGAIFLAAALLFLGRAWAGSRHRLQADRESIEFPGGQRIRFDRIVRVDNRKWNDQGISRIEWRDDKGQITSTRLDCLKYDTACAEEIMSRILAAPGIELISAP